MKTTRLPSLLSKCIAASLISSILWAPISHAVELTDAPMEVVRYASPNIMFTLDNSGSMRLAYSHPGAMYTTIDGDRIPLILQRNCTKNSFANKVYYNPSIGYTPGMRPNGESYPNADFFAAYSNGYDHNEPYATRGSSPRDYESASRNAYSRGYEDGRLVTRPGPSPDRGPTRDNEERTIRQPFSERNTWQYVVPTHREAYDRGYDDASSGHGSRESEYVYTYYRRINETERSPVNLSNSFQAYFDEGGQIFLSQIKNNGQDEKEYHFSEKAPAYYTRYIGPGTPEVGRCYPDDHYQKIEITSSDERRNFANWFSYHRTRILTMQTALSIAFSTITDRYRVGFGTINENYRYFLPIDDFKNCGLGSGCQKDSWYAALFSIKDPAGGTPLMDASSKVGEYFKTGSMPGANRGSQKDPILRSCQRNYHILSTDGFATNTVYLPVGNTDRVVPNNLPVSETYNPITKTRERGVFDAVADTMLVPGISFPPPYLESSADAGDFLSDVAMKYWITDLRPDMPNNVPPTESNPATWQHVTMHTVGLGVEGTIAVNKENYDALVQGRLQWPAPVRGSLTMMDDMWHAAINGHGLHFTTDDPASLQRGLEEALTNAVSFDVGSAAIAVDNPELSSQNNTAFVSGYNSGIWSGKLHAFPVDLTTGVVQRNRKLWAAETLLDARDWASRRIASYSGNAGVPFSTEKLASEQLARLNTPNANDHANVINFLRGDTSQEGSAYRRRGSRLGDIVNAVPLYVGAPSASYGDAGYQAFKSAQANRTKMVYQGANDGMLHAFRAKTGTEEWAYVPGRLIWQNHVTPTKTYYSTSTLVNLSSNKGFSHRYYVDGTPVAVDVDLNNSFGIPNRGASAATPQWATLLVGGLNKGGRGYYALDITSPGAVNESDVASKVKWEFPRADTNEATARNVGYSFGKPVIVKTVAAGWVVLVTSGHNNGGDTGGDGKGYLFVLNARTGEVIETLSTGEGSAGTPSGLAHINGYVEFAERDRTVQYVYGGDLLGNVWRFDLTGIDKANWSVKKLATLTDATGNAQPITTAPELTKFGDKRLVLLGTGQYLGLSDVPGNTFSNLHASQPQSFYVLTDDLSPNPLISPLRTQLVKKTITLTGAATSISSDNVDLSTTRGWYADLPHVAERSVTHPIVVRGVVAFTTNIPGSDTCQLGGSSWLYVLNVKDGSKRNEVAGTFLGNTLASEVVPVRRQGIGAIEGIIRKSDGETATERLTDRPARALQRKMWREIIRE